MLEVTVNTVEGVEFIKDVRILEPDGTYLGVPYHSVAYNTKPEILRMIKATGLRKAGRLEENFIGDMYTEGSVFYWRLIIARALFRTYWAAVKWLYDNARVFKQIPVGSQFSWSYFTPYCWYLNVKAKFLWLLN